ncbi:mycofactocin biosynthesis peptidyl-dipeptidase MftE [Luteipulveratus halotolerans]|uniref:Creatininase n=1 Tax=Luteipulveratus halotolerans TaxID=1631356 RepID=A0A0L6CJU9_9MICO|nr:mycofactocin biosynthesis peptidyl-dipeptidase MftE [Luteipulveratus halotolerans]KNX37895.1 creatininase [Luteipulveratus halotolerans]
MDVAAHPPAVLAWQRSPQVADAAPLVLVPVGSVEQHGPHLPLGTDTLVAQAVAARAAALVDDPEHPVTVAPAIAFGASGEHEGFAGTVSIGQDALGAVVLELGRSACRWARGVVLVNAHGGNAVPLARAVERLRFEGRAVAWVAAGVADGDAHAGRTETSLMLHLLPDAVRLDLAEAGPTAPVSTMLGRLRAGGVHEVSPNGVLGDPAGATAAEGGHVLARVVDDVVARLRLLEVGEHGMLAAPSGVTAS